MAGFCLGMGLEGIGFVLSPAAYVAWEHASERAHFWPSRGLLHIILALDGHQGVWHLASVCGATMQCTAADKADFIQSLESCWDSVPAGDVAYAVGDYNCKVGFRAREGALVAPANG